MNDAAIAGPSGDDTPMPAGALAAAEQSKAIAEVQAALVIARARPRDIAAIEKMLLADCSRIALAQEATYEYPRGRSLVTGPSIRLAEVIARRWGNMEAGVKELSRANGVSEAMAYAWDYESNFRDVRAFTVRHWRDTRTGGYPITDERSIYEMIANAGARRKRACILAVVDGDIVEAAQRKCEATILKHVDVNEETVAKMLECFGEFNVTPEQIEQHFQWRLNALTPKMFLSLRKIYNSLKDGFSAPSEWFEMPANDPAANVVTGGSRTAAVKSRMKGRKARASSPARKGEAPAYATIAEALKAAKTRQVLDEAADLIRGIPDEAQRTELEQLYSVRAADIDEGGE